MFNVDNRSAHAGKCIVHTGFDVIQTLQWINSGKLNVPDMLPVEV